MRILVIIACALIGLILGFLAWLVYEIGPIRIWYKLPPPPSSTIELIPGGDPALYIKTLSGSTYHYEDWHNKGWVEEAIPQDARVYFEITKPCDLFTPEFIILSSPPKDIIDCVQEMVKYADGYTRYSFVLDIDGYIWQSEKTWNAYDFLEVKLGFLGFGLFLGICIGSIFPKPQNRYKGNVINTNGCKSEKRANTGST